jgi:hypothetical protein
MKSKTKRCPSRKRHLPCNAASRVAIPDNKGKAEREPCVSQANVCRHEFPLSLRSSHL